MNKTKRSTRNARIWTLWFYENMSQSAIARMLDIDRVTVWRVIKQAKEKGVGSL